MDNLQAPAKKMKTEAQEPKLETSTSEPKLEPKLEPSTSGLTVVGDDDWDASIDKEQEKFLSDMGLSVGSRLEVLWDLEVDEQQSSEWWACTLSGAFKTQGGSFEWRLLYDSNHGFQSEARKVVFSDECQELRDVDEDASMPWRLEGDLDEEVEEGDMWPEGTKVKARWQGGERFYAGQVVAANEDGSYHIKYDDGAEEMVPRDEVELAQGAQPTDSDILGIETFWKTFVDGLVSGKIFTMLPPDKQATLAECVRNTKPIFEEELQKIRHSRGDGAVITAEDMTTLITPKVMPKAVEEFKRLTAFP